VPAFHLASVKKEKKHRKRQLLPEVHETACVVSMHAAPAPGRAPRIADRFGGVDHDVAGELTQAGRVSNRSWYRATICRPQPHHGLSGQSRLRPGRLLAHPVRACPDLIAVPGENRHPVCGAAATNDAGCYASFDLAVLLTPSQTPLGEYFDLVTP
jgi:hypothetical protein